MASSPLPFVSLYTIATAETPWLHLIESIRHQTYPREKMEWVIFKTPATNLSDILPKTGDLRHIIKYVHIELPPQTRQEQEDNVLKYCQGEYIVTIDDETYYPPSRVEHAVQTMLRYPKSIAGGLLTHYVYLSHSKQVGKIINETVHPASKIIKRDGGASSSSSATTVVTLDPFLTMLYFSSSDTENIQIHSPALPPETFFTGPCSLACQNYYLSVGVIADVDAGDDTSSQEQTIHITPGITTIVETEPATTRIDFSKRIDQLEKDIEKITREIATLRDLLAKNKDKQRYQKKASLAD
jgi:hypothetical protein